MPSHQLPSLNALRAFAEVGNRLNLKAAAEALFVTPSALSHQIRGLEQRLGVKLFTRSHHGMALTEAGRKILPGVSEAFDLLHATMAELNTKPDHKTLTVSMLSTFAMRWFIPRLSGFQKLYPDIEVRISTSVELTDFQREDVDCAIRSGRGDWPGLVIKHLFSEQLTPVCSPAIKLNSLQELANQTLLHARLRPDDWHIWLHSAGVGDLKPAHEQTFETRNFAIAAAIEGVGVAVVDPALVREDIQSGRLIQPFAPTIASENAYHLVYPEQNAKDPPLIAFGNWLLDEARK